MLDTRKPVFGAEKSYFKSLESVKVLYPENIKDIKKLFTDARQTSLPESSSDDVFANNIYEDSGYVNNFSDKNRFGLKDGEDLFSYDNLVKKPNMQVTTVDENVPRLNNGKVDRTAVTWRRKKI